MSVWGGGEWGDEVKQGWENCPMGMVGITEKIILCHIGRTYGHAKSFSRNFVYS